MAMTVLKPTGFGRILIAVTATLVTVLVSSDAVGETSLRSRVAVNEPARVEIVLEVGGTLRLKDGDSLRTFPTSVHARLSYDETLQSDVDGLRRGLRRYRSAEATIQVEKQTTTPKLRDERRIVVVESTEAQPLLFSPQGPFTADELELLQVPACSLLVERLLPTEAVAKGDSWKHDEELLAGLLNLDAVSGGDVRSTLVDADEQVARVEIKGVVQGALGGVAADVDLVGRYTFDYKAGRITWLALIVKERRSIGHVEPGVEVTAKLQMTVTPSDGEESSAAAIADLDLTTTPEVVRIEYPSAKHGYRFEHDRRWHVMSDHGDVLAMRLIDRGELVAQCNVTAVAASDPDRRPTLDRFQADIRRSLDKHFGQFVRVTETENSLGYVIFRAEAVGRVDDLEIAWRYYLVQDSSGRQVVFAFTCEQSLVERFADADEAIVSTLRWAENRSAAVPTEAPQLR